MPEESPWEAVVRLRSEGVTDARIAVALADRGLTDEDIQLLLATRVSEPKNRVSAPSPSNVETAWAVVQRMRAEGFGRSEIERELTSRGFAAEDVAALFADDGRERPTTPLHEASGTTVDWVSMVFGALLVLAGAALLFSGRVSLLPFGLVLTGLERIVQGLRARHDRVTLSNLSSGLQPLATDDPRARCNVHPTFASIGTCERCGAFCCAGCVSSEGLSRDLPCMTCLVRPEVRAARLQKLARRVARRLLVAPAGLVAFFVASFSFDTEMNVISFVVLSTVVAVPPLTLATLHWFIPGGWGRWAVATLWLVIAVGLFLLALFADAWSIELLIWVVGLWPVVTAFRGYTTIDTPPRPLVVV